MARDGMQPDPQALVHPSETALDDYEAFDFVVDGNNPLERVVTDILDWLPPR